MGHREDWLMGTDITFLLCCYCDTFH